MQNNLAIKDMFHDRPSYKRRGRTIWICILAFVAILIGGVIGFIFGTVSVDSTIPEMTPRQMIESRWNHESVEIPADGAGLLMQQKSHFHIDHVQNGENGGLIISWKSPAEYADTVEAMRNEITNTVRMLEASEDCPEFQSGTISDDFCTITVQTYVKQERLISVNKLQRLRSLLVAYDRIYNLNDFGSAQIIFVNNQTNEVVCRIGG